MIDYKKLIELKHIRTFYHVSNLKSFSAAAEKLHMSQPAVSQHIKKIESQIDGKLFNRKGEFELTAEGQILFKYAILGLNLIEDFYNEIDNSKEQHCYKIAIHYAFCYEIRDEFLKKLSKIKSANFSIFHFHSYSELNIKDFDLILGIGNTPENHGVELLFKSSHYQIACKHNELTFGNINPKRVIAFSNLNQEQAKNIINSYGGNTNNIKKWLFSYSKEFMIGELNKPDTILISPKCFTTTENLQIINTNIEEKSHIWCNSKSHGILNNMGLNEIINHLEEIHQC